MDLPSTCISIKTFVRVEKLIGTNLKGIDDYKESCDECLILVYRYCFTSDLSSSQGTG